MRKGVLISASILALVLALLYSIPKFIDFNKYKEKFVNEITKVFEVPIRIDGDISMAIVPNGYIIVKDIKILNAESTDAVLSIEDFYIEISPMDLFNIENIKLQKVILSGLNTSSYGNAQTGADKQMLEKVLSGDMFNKIQTMQIQNSNISYQNNITAKQEDILDINLSVSKKKNAANTYDVFGTLNVRNTPVNIKAMVVIDDIDNYDASINIERKKSGSEVANMELKISKRNELLNITGDTNIKSDDIESFMKESMPEFPDLKITSGSSKLSAKIKFTQNILQITGIQLVNGSTFGTGNFDYDIGNDTKILDMKFSYFEASENITGKNNRINLLKKAITELKGIEVNLFIDSFAAGKTKIKNIKLRTDSPKQNPNVLNIKELAISSEEIDGSTSGLLSLKNDRVVMDLKARAKTDFTYRIDGLNPISINSFDGAIKGIADDMEITVDSMQTNFGTLAGIVVKKFSNNKNTYDIAINSRNINADAILSKDIFSALKNKDKIEFLNNAEIKFKIDSENFTYKKTGLKSFVFSGTLFENSVDISGMDWTADDYTILLKGKLNNIGGNAGEMENISYEIKSFDFTNIKTGYISQIPFLYDLLKGESGTIAFVLNGHANNPKITVSGKTSNMDLSADISSIRKNNANMTVSVSHQNAKLFINKIYGGEYDLTSKTLKNNIGVSFQSRIRNDKSDIVFEDIKGTVASQPINGKITIDRRGTVTANMNSDNINLTQIIKNSSNDYKQNAMIYLLNNTGANINLAVKNLLTYSRAYSNVEVGINKFASSPAFLLNANFDANSGISIKGSIANGNVYSGTLKLSSIGIMAPFFGISNFDILSGYMNADVSFRTYGIDKSEFISRLSGTANAEFTNGRLTGMTNKSDIEYKIYSQPNVITNNVIDIIEQSMVSGEADFSSVKIIGNIENGIINNGAITVTSEDLTLSGNINSANLISKFISFSGSALLSQILPDPMQIVYNVNGFSQNVEKNVVLENIISRVNPTYFQMKKKEYFEKNGILASEINNQNRPNFLPPSFGAHNRPQPPSSPFADFGKDRPKTPGFGGEPGQNNRPNNPAFPNRPSENQNNGGRNDNGNFQKPNNDLMEIPNDWGSPSDTQTPLDTTAPQEPENDSDDEQNPPPAPPPEEEYIDEGEADGGNNARTNDRPTAQTRPRPETNPNTNQNRQSDQRPVNTSQRPNNHPPSATRNPTPPRNIIRTASTTFEYGDDNAETTNDFNADEYHEEIPDEEDEEFAE